MSALMKILDEIPDITVEEVSLEQIVAQFPHLKEDDPLLYILYLRFNEDSMTDENKDICNRIIIKLQKNVVVMNKVNMDKFKPEEISKV
jgi:hypothetical protein